MDKIFKYYMIISCIFGIIFVSVFGGEYIVSMIISILVWGFVVAFLMAIVQGNSNSKNYKSSHTNNKNKIKKNTYDYLSSNKKEESKSIKNAKDTFYTNRSYKSPLKDSADSWDDFYELKKAAKKELDKGNITRKEYDKIVRDAENRI